jgi:hypothetical protein
MLQMAESTRERKTTMMITIALVAALGILVAAVGVTIVAPIQQAEAKGCPTPNFANPTAPGYFNSEQRCFTIPNTPR